jgi:hypothetical protein
MSSIGIISTKREQIKNLMNDLSTDISNTLSKAKTDTDSYNKNIIKKEDKNSDENIKLKNSMIENENYINSLNLKINMLKSSNNIQNKENEKMKELINIVQENLKSYKIILEKEIELKKQIEFNIQNKNDINNNEKLNIINILSENLKYLKELSGINIIKNNGNLKIIFGEENNNVQNKYIIIQLVGNYYKIIETFPSFNYSQFETELNQYGNFTLFICKIVEIFENLNN